MPSEYSGWICPACGRRFKQPTAEHSCARYPLEHHLAGKPADTVALSEAYLALVRALGEVSIEPVKTAILLRRLTNFGAVKVVRSGLRCSLLLPYLPESGKLTSTMRYAPQKLACHFNLACMEDLDGEVHGWLQDAYDLAGPAAPARLRG
jgi:hypothetical protein